LKIRREKRIMNKIRLGIVGPGIIWERTHKNILKEFGNNFEIAAFCARSEKSRNKVKEEFPEAPFYTDYRELVRQPFIDAVLVMTPIPMNPVVTKEALEAGKDVFVEKPMATNVSDAEELIKKEKESGKRIYILEQYVYRKFTDEMIKIIKSNRLGDVLMFDRTFHGHIGFDENDRLNYGNTDWRMNAQYPLGMLMDGGIHEIAMITKIFGEPLTVFAAGVKYREQSYGDYDYESIIFEYASKLIGTLCISYYLDGNRNYFIVRGTNGLAFYDEGSKVVVEGNDGTREEIEAYEADPYYEMWKDFVSCLENNSKPYYTSERALLDIRILEAINKSLKESVKVQI
jgi:predicted dehydrogenase